MSIYEAALKTLEAFKKDGSLPKAFVKTDPIHIELNRQLDALAGEYQSEIDDAQRNLDEIEGFERAWDKLQPTEKG